MESGKMEGVVRGRVLSVNEIYRRFVQDLATIFGMEAINLFLSMREMARHLKCAYKKKERRELIEGVTSVDETSKFYLKVPLDLRVRPKLEKITLLKKPLPPMSFSRLLMGKGEKKKRGRDEVADFPSSSRRDKNFVQFHLWREGWSLENGRRRQREKRGKNEVADFSSSSRRDKNFVQFHFGEKNVVSENGRRRRGRVLSVNEIYRCFVQDLPKPFWNGSLINLFFQCEKWLDI
ncbi:hypothetical protein CEXT_297761 [Caerostris extrusa]|uniref:Uncharacterized protein n=1 Tax=Caerostris extrusa TaxID=172846 RepID=A0AAV4VMB4_CAEEX|nr:hypothetical protein CEXT_297761 [Caerostris extrusa]